MARGDGGGHGHTAQWRAMTAAATAMPAQEGWTKVRRGRRGSPFQAVIVINS